MGTVPRAIQNQEPMAEVAAHFEPQRALAKLAGFVGFGVVVSGIYALTGLGAPCPFRFVTGWDCPLCGGTRLGNALLHFDIGAAFLYNPVVFIGLMVITVLGGAWLVEALGGPAIRPPRRVREFFSRTSQAKLVVIAGVLVAIWTVARNLWL